MLKVLRRWWRDEDGTVAVEFALTAPIFVILITGLMDFGLAARKSSELNAAARAGLQAVFTDNTQTALAQTTAEELAPDATVTVSSSCICSDGAAVACSGSCGVNNLQRVVTVTVEEDYSLLMPWPGITDPWPMTGIAMVRVQ